MTGSDFFCAQPHGVVQEGLELDFGVAQDVGVGRSAALVFAQKLGKDAVFVFGGKVDVLDFNAEHIGDRRGVQEIDVG